MYEIDCQNKQTCLTNLNNTKLGLIIVKLKNDQSFFREKIKNEIQGQLLYCINNILKDGIQTNLEKLF